MKENTNMDIVEREINPENPVFVFYIKTTNMSRLSGHECIERARKEYSYSNAECIFIGSDIDKVECIYFGSYGREKFTEVNDLILELRERMLKKKEGN